MAANRVLVGYVDKNVLADCSVDILQAFQRKMENFVYYNLLEKKHRKINICKEKQAQVICDPI